MEVSMSGYYAWVKRPESERKRQNQQLLERIKCIHKQSRQTYGSPRVYVDLKKQDIPCSLNRVARLMQLNHRVIAPKIGEKGKRGYFREWKYPSILKTCPTFG
jgi:transposase InsO family protein